MILEGIVTTANADGSPNVAPMGPIVDPAFRTLVLRPYQTSQTYANLKRHGRGVLHVTDDVELLARAAVNRLECVPEMLSVPGVDGFIIASACRWYAFEVTRLDDREPRTHIEATVTASGRLRDFFGFNRAKHAVLEAAILATRLEFLPHDEVLAELERLQVPVDKTAGPAERRAFDFLVDYVRQAAKAANHA